jgi:hypothetical protein
MKSKSKKRKLARRKTKLSLPDLPTDQAAEDRRLASGKTVPDRQTRRNSLPFVI